MCAAHLWPERPAQSAWHPAPTRASIASASRFGTIEFGGKIRNAHKFDDTYDETFKPNSDACSVANSSRVGLNNFTDPDYYDKTYHVGPVTDYAKVRAYVNSNPGLFTHVRRPWHQRQQLRLGRAYPGRLPDEHHRAGQPRALRRRAAI